MRHKSIKVNIIANINNKKMYQQILWTITFTCINNFNTKFLIIKEL